jgi:hypothetical protein
LARRAPAIQPSRQHRERRHVAPRRDRAPRPAVVVVRRGAVVVASASAVDDVAGTGGGCYGRGRASVRGHRRGRERVAGAVHEPRRRQRRRRHGHGGLRHRHLHEGAAHMRRAVGVGGRGRGGARRRAQEHGGQPLLLQLPVEVLVDEAQRLDGRRDAAAAAAHRRATGHHVPGRPGVPLPERHVLADDAGRVEPRQRDHPDGGGARLLVVVVGRGGAASVDRRRRHRMMSAEEAQPRRLLVGGGGGLWGQVEREPRGGGRRRRSSSSRHGGRGARALVLAAAPADGHVAERAALGPVPAAGLAEVARLREAVVVVVAELGVGGVAARAPQPLLGRRGRLRLRLRGRRRSAPGAGAALTCTDRVVPRRRRHINNIRTSQQSRS